jgi:asparaginyl-tRNA synthetase
VSWGLDLQTEHERFLSEEIFKARHRLRLSQDIKAFYMRQNDDGRTVAAMDVLVPRVGEIIGGSQREERADVLAARIREMGLPEEEYWWYMELRRYGSVPHSGFGMGFERLLMMVTGVTNIRDVIPCPRTPRHLEF